jgi:hypothetical protein
VLTDGRITTATNGEELKAFNIKDGLGIKLLQRSGIRGRHHHGAQLGHRRAPRPRAGIEPVVQGREDKLVALRELCAALASSSPTAPTWATTCRISPPSKRRRAGPDRRRRLPPCARRRLVQHAGRRPVPCARPATPCSSARGELAAIEADYAIDARGA